MEELGLDVPPHLRAKIHEQSVLEVALFGRLSLRDLRLTLASEKLFAFCHAHRPRTALLDLTRLESLEPDAIAHASGFWLNELADAGCARLAIIVPKGATPQSAKPPVAELFEDRQSAMKWVGLVEPSRSTMVPRLRAGDWPGAAAALGRRLFPGTADAFVPFVCLQMDVSGRRVTALRDPSASSPADEIALFDEAVAALDSMVPASAVEESPIGPPAKLLRWAGALAAEVVLSRPHLLAAQRALGAETIAVAVPEASLALAADASAANHGTLAALETLARRRFLDAGASALTPRLFLVSDGRVLGALDLARPHQPDASQPPAAPLRARCDAEAQLYMDLRFASPSRSRTLVPGADGVVTLYTAQVEGEPEPSRFAFLIADPQGTLGVGGVKGPSTILGPSELATWADILAKRNPASPDGLSMAQREVAERELLTAAHCLEEIMKLIPPGASAVPESAFHGDAARRMYAREPGRFDGARLEAVAQAYRGCAARVAPERGDAAGSVRRRP